VKSEREGTGARRAYLGRGDAGSDSADLKTEGYTAGQALAWASVDAGGAGDLGLSVFLGAGSNVGNPLKTGDGAVS
jgi:hypothetical protein